MNDIILVGALGILLTSIILIPVITQKEVITQQEINFNYIYKNLSREVPIHEEIFVEIKPIYFLNNNSWSKGYNYTRKEKKGSKIEYYVEEGITNREGIKIKNKTLIGWYSVCGNYLVHHLVNPGDRNEDEFCRCMQHEIDKMVCEEVDLLE